MANSSKMTTESFISFLKTIKENDKISFKYDRLEGDTEGTVINMSAKEKERPWISVKTNNEDYKYLALFPNFILGNDGLKKLSQNGGKRKSIKKKSKKSKSLRR